MLAAIEKTIAQIVRFVAILGGAGLLFAIAITCLSIIGRLCHRLLDAMLGANFNLPILSDIGPILGEEELVRYAVGFALFAALPWLTLQKGHITVDLFKPIFNNTINRLLDLLGNVFFAVIVYLIMTQQWFLIFRKTRGEQDTLLQQLLSGDWAGIMSLIRIRDESQILGLKLLPFYAVAEFCVILLFIVSVFCILRAAGELINETKHV